MSPSAWAAASSVLTDAAPLNLRQLNVASITIPSDLGRIVDRWQPPDALPKALVIHLQDLHTHPEAQEHINRLIGEFRRKFGVTLVAHEGASGLCDTELYSGLPDPPSTERVAKRFMQEGLFTGAEYYAITHPGAVEVWGVEDQPTYQKHLDVYRRRAREGLPHAVTVAHLGVLLAQLRRVIYSPELRRLAAAKRRGPAKAYRTRLLHAAAAHGIRVERSQPLEAIESVVRAKLLATEDQRQLARLIEWQELLWRLSNFQLTPAQWARFQQVRPELSADAVWSFLLKHQDALREEPAPSFQEELAAAFEQLPANSEFYDAATQRDEPFVRHTLEQLAARQRPAAVLVAGGFHSRGITDRLRAARVAYVVISPKVSADFDESRYAANLQKTFDSVEDLFRQPDHLIAPLSTAASSGTKQLTMFAGFLRDKIQHELRAHRSLKPILDWIAAHPREAKLYGLALTLVAGKVILTALGHDVSFNATDGALVALAAGTTALPPGQEEPERDMPSDADDGVVPDEDAPELSPAQEEERMVRELRDAMADAIAQPADVVEGIVRSLPSEMRFQAWARRLNLGSPFYREQMRQAWSGDPQRTLERLAAGYTTRHYLDNSRGRLMLRADMLPRELLGELPDGLLAHRVYESKRAALHEVEVEWVWFPERRAWLPMMVSTPGHAPGAPPVQLKVIMENTGEIVKIAGRLSRAQLRRWAQQMGTYRLASRVVFGEKGSISIGSEILPAAGRRPGVYTMQAWRGHPFEAVIGRDGVPTEFRFYPSTERVEPVGLRLIVTKDASGAIRQVLESHESVFGDTLRDLAETAGPIWVQGPIVTKPIESAGGIDSLVKIGSRSVAAGQTETISFAYKVPAAYAGMQAEALIGTSGVPVYLHIVGQGDRLPDLKEWLKCVEIRTERGALLEVISSSRVNVYSDILRHALARAQALTGQVVVTRNKILLFPPGSPMRYLDIGGQRIYLPAALVRDLPDEPVGEVTYASSQGFQDPVPVRLRVGRYEPDDPLRFPDIRFLALRDYAVKPHPTITGVFVVVAPPASDTSAAPEGPSGDSDALAHFDAANRAGLEYPATLTPEEQQAVKTLLREPAIPIRITQGQWDVQLTAEQRAALIELLSLTSDQVDALLRERLQSVIRARAENLGLDATALPDDAYTLYFGDPDHHPTDTFNFASPYGNHRADHAFFVDLRHLANLPRAHRATSLLFGLSHEGIHELAKAGNELHERLTPQDAVLLQTGELNQRNVLPASDEFRDAFLQTVDARSPLVRAVFVARLMFGGAGSARNAPAPPQAEERERPTDAPQAARSSDTESLVQRVVGFATPPAGVDEDALGEGRRRLIAFYEALLDLLAARGVFDGHTLVYPIAGDDIFPARVAPMVALDRTGLHAAATRFVERVTDRSAAAYTRQLVYRRVELPAASTPPAAAADWYRASVDSAVQTPYKTIILKGLLDFFCQDDPQLLRQYLEAMEAYLQPGDRLLVLNHKDAQAGVEELLRRGWQRVEWLEQPHADRLYAAIRSMATDPQNRRLHDWLTTAHSFLLVPDDLLLLERSGAHGPTSRSGDAPALGSPAEVSARLNPLYPEWKNADIVVSGFGTFAPSTFVELRQVFEQVPVRPGEQFVDLGSGDARVVVFAALLGADAVGIEGAEEVFGLGVRRTEAALAADLSLPAFDRMDDADGSVRWVRRDGGPGTIHLRKGDFLAQEFSFRDADVVFYYSSAQGIAPASPLAQKLAAQLRPGARLLVTRLSPLAPTMPAPFHLERSLTVRGLRADLYRLGDGQAGGTPTPEELAAREAASQASAASASAGPEPLTPVGLLMRGIQDITEAEYLRVRRNGLQSKNVGGVSKDPTNYFPDVVSLSLSFDRIFQAASLFDYGPLGIGRSGAPSNVAFVMDPVYVRAHPEQFTLVGRLFQETPEIFEQGVKHLGLDQRPVEVRPRAFFDEVHSVGMPPEAIQALIVHPDMVARIRAWDAQHGLAPLPLYVLAPPGPDQRLPDKLEPWPAVSQPVRWPGRGPVSGAAPAPEELAAHEAASQASAVHTVAVRLLVGLETDPEAVRAELLAMPEPQREAVRLEAIRHLARQLTESAATLTEFEPLPPVPERYRGGYTREGLAELAYQLRQTGQAIGGQPETVAAYLMSGERARRLLAQRGVEEYLAHLKLVWLLALPERLAIIEPASGMDYAPAYLFPFLGVTLHEDSRLLTPLPPEEMFPSELTGVDAPHLLANFQRNFRAVVGVDALDVPRLRGTIEADPRLAGTTRAILVKYFGRWVRHYSDGPLPEHFLRTWAQRLDEQVLRPGDLVILPDPPSREDRRDRAEIVEQLLARGYHRLFAPEALADQIRASEPSRDIILNDIDGRTVEWMRTSLVLQKPRD